VPQDFYTPQALAEYLNVSLSTVYQWRARGTGPQAHKLGRAVRFRKTDVEAWLEGQRAMPSVPSPAA
jgi:excisionase family DNA binding protein